MIKLKPCPFCGGEAEKQKGIGEASYVACTKCGAMAVTIYGEMGAVEAWNRRDGCKECDWACDTYDCGYRGMDWEKEGDR